ncbi:MAG: hypothetical protein ACXAEF_16440, partial [Candidatus Thorarchaeota archaeon]
MHRSTMKSIGIVVVVLILLSPSMGRYESSVSYEVGAVQTFHHHSSTSTSNMSIVWNSTESPAFSTLTNDSEITGNNIVLTNSFNDTGNPYDLKIANTTSTSTWGVYENHSGVIDACSSPYVPYLDTSLTVPLDDLLWIEVKNAVPGKCIFAEFFVDSDDGQIMVWYADTDNSTWTFENNLYDDGMDCQSNPQIGSVTP